MYVLAPFSFCHDGGDNDGDAVADANDPVNNDGDRRELLLISVLAVNLPSVAELVRVANIVDGLSMEVSAFFCDVLLSDCFCGVFVCFFKCDNFADVGMEDML